MSDLSVKDFNFELPEHLIAQLPAERRESAKLLLYRHGEITHRIFADLPKLLPESTLLIANNTKVIPSRLMVTLKSGSKGELFFLGTPKGNPAQARALARPKKKLLRDQTVSLGEGTFNLSIAGVSDSEEEVSVRFPCSELEAQALLQQQGLIPLPPYIKRSQGDLVQKEFDRERYQTVFHQHAGSSAAPTAGLHFSKPLLQSLGQAGHDMAYVTLHVGLGTFAPIRSLSPQDHQMHTEHYRISRESLEKIFNQIDKRLPIVFVGTTSLRAIESFFRKGLARSAMLGIADDWHATNLFLFPKTPEDRIKPCIGEGMITNFHLPQSTLLMLISAIMGYKRTKDLYQEAIKHEYRFFSYGDSSLLFW